MWQQQQEQAQQHKEEQRRLKDKQLQQQLNRLGLVVLEMTLLEHSVQPQV